MKYRKFGAFLALGLVAPLLWGCHGAGHDDSLIDINLEDITSFEITCDKATAPVTDELTLTVGDKATLAVSYEPASFNLNFEGEITDQSIATCEGMVITALKAGSTFLSLHCVELPVLKKMFVLHVEDPIGQKGVGSGTSPEDPLFLGNEGTRRPVEIHFIEMQRQYADAVYIKKGLLDILIDSGTSDDGEHVKEFLLNHMEDKTLDLVMVSHAHEDHYGGMATALEAVESVSAFIDYGGLSKNSYSFARDEFIAKGAKHYAALDCVRYANGAVKDWYLTKDFGFSVLDTGHYIDLNGVAANPESLTVLFKYHDFTYFTAGDLTSGAEATLLQNEDLHPVSLYKASHHGSHGSNSSAILNALNPYCVGISASIVGNVNDKPTGISGHPAGAAIERIYQTPQIKENRNVYWNGVNGDMCFTTYGGAKDITFKGSPTIKGYYVKNEETGEMEKVTGEDNLKFSETKLFKLRGYDSFLTA